MLETSARLLRLLGLFQTHPSFTGAELAERLDVTPRTVRRDVERLRALGYPINAEQGTGGYRLAAGSHLPPLLLEDDEAVAIVLGLRAAAQTAVHGVEESALQALAKLEQVLPSRLRYRVETLTKATVHAGKTVEPSVSVDVLLDVAEACRRQERLRFDYESPYSGPSRRDAEPHRIVCCNGRWYLIAFDVVRDDWRTFRVDRLTPRVPGGPRFTPREIPYGDPVTFLEHQLSAHAWLYRADVRLTGAIEDLAEKIWPGMGALEPDGPQHCLFHVGAPSVDDLLWMITSVNVPFEIVEAPEQLVAALRIHIERCVTALGATKGQS